jgi:hypothetical protein
VGPGNKTFGARIKSTPTSLLVPPLLYEDSALEFPGIETETTVADM